MKNNSFDKYFTSWNEGNTGYFKVAPITINITKDAVKLEQLAKKAAEEIKAEVSYAWDLGEKSSDAWWLTWGGYSLEEEIPYYAATTMPEAIDKLNSFDPEDNDYECSTVEEFKDMLFSAYDEELKKSDLNRGFQLWIASLDSKAAKTLKYDLESWTARAKDL